MVVMERASRYLAELDCGTKDQALFERVLENLIQLSSQDIHFFSDGERRYSQTLFQLCQQSKVQDGQAQKTLPDGLQVRLKNKGSREAENPRPKYETPVPHAPKTVQACSGHWIRTGSFTTLSGPISPPARFPPWRWVSMTNGLRCLSSS